MNTVYVSDLDWYLQAFLSMPLNGSNTSKTFRDIFVDSECFGRTQKPKAENIIAICQRNSLKNAIYIGDTESDRLAAMKAGVDFIHVSYRFGYVESANLKSAASFSEVVEILLTFINPPSVVIESITASD